MDFHAITTRGTELLLRVVDDQVIIVPPAPAVPRAGPEPAPPLPPARR
jgi:hypothetical protein